MLGSTVLQGLLLAGALAAGAALGAKPMTERLVPVTFVPSPPPPAPASALEKAAGPTGTPMPAARPARRKPPREEAKPAPPPPKLVPPKELPETLPPVAAAPAPEPAPAPAAGSEGGVVGGAPGGGGGAPVPGAAGPLGAPGRIVEDAPEDGAERNRRPRAADPGCMDRSQEREPELEDHPELAGRAVDVEFQVGPTGEVSRFRPLDRDVAGPLQRAMWSAIRRCRWIPGTDAEGRPAARTLSLRFRFQ